jgi:hypothetical protein
MSILPNLAAQATDMARRVGAQGESQRYWRINRLEAVWGGQRYQLEGRPSFWDNSVPLRDRAPAVQSHLPRTAGLRLAHMVFGERSFPTCQIAGGGYGTTLTPADVEALGALVKELIPAAKLSTKARAYLIEGLKSGTSVCIQALCEGKPSIKIFPAKHCTPVLDAHGRVESMVIEYKYPSPVPGEFVWYHREIANGLDRVWDPTPVTAKRPEWSKLPLASETEIEFCAVSWTRCLAEEVDDGIDGHALAEGLEREVEAIDLELSQLYRSGVYNGDPQVVRIGLDVDAPAMGPTGPTASAAPPGFSWFNSVLPSWARSNGAQVTQKGPTKIWDLPLGADAKLLESTGKPAEIITGALTELRRVVTDAFGVVLADPESLGTGDLSARALAMLHGPMLDTADNLRSEYGDALIEIISQLLRLCAGEAAARDGVHLAAWEAARPALAKCWATRGDGTRAWVGPAITLQWGEYFEPAWSEIASAVDATVKATAGKVMSQRQAVALLSPLSGVTDIDAELAALEAEGPPAVGAPIPSTGVAP